jgi:hypothetical protein
MKNFWLIFLALCGFGSPLAYSQWKEPPSTGSPEYRLPDRTYIAGQSGMAPTLTATLQAPENNAAHHTVVVRAQTDGVELQYPQAKDEPLLGCGHIEYQLDGSMPENTAARLWTFSRISPGDHTITVRLVGADNQELVKPTRLRVHVP